MSKVARLPLDWTTLIPVTQSGLTGNVGAGNLASWTDRFRRMYPVEVVDAALGAGYTTSATLLSDGTGWSTLLSEIESKRIADGNLVLTIPQYSRANAGGEYRVDFPAVGQGHFLAFSYRVKADAPAIALPGRKEFILWRGSSSCTDLELAQTHYYSTPMVSPYTNCGAKSFVKDLGNGAAAVHSVSLGTGAVSR